MQALTEIRAELKNGAAMAAAPELFEIVITDDEAGLIETVNGNIRITPLWKWLPGESGCEVCHTKATRTLQRTPPN